MNPVELKRAGRFKDEVMEHFFPTNNERQGYPLPWGPFDDGFEVRSNELSIITGINGHGKSQWLGHLLIELMHQRRKSLLV